MKRIHLAFAAALAVATPLAVRTAGAAGPELKTDEDKTFYALGVMMSSNLQSFALSPAELALVQAGLSDGVQDKVSKDIDLQKMASKVQDLAKARRSVAADKEKKAGEEFLAKAAGEKGATKTDSGLVYVESQAGTGKSPKATDKVKVHYHGTLTDGTVFDSSKDRGEPVSFPLNGVIPCWTEGVQKMKVGGKSRLVCPSGIAYGDRGAPPKIKPGATLVFDVELIEVEEQAPKPAAAPATGGTGK